MGDDCDCCSMSLFIKSRFIRSVLSPSISSLRPINTLALAPLCQAGDPRRENAKHWVHVIRSEHSHQIGELIAYDRGYLDGGQTYIRMRSHSEQVESLVAGTRVPAGRGKSTPPSALALQLGRQRSGRWPPPSLPACRSLQHPADHRLNPVEVREVARLQSVP